MYYKYKQIKQAILNKNDKIKLRIRKTYKAKNRLVSQTHFPVPATATKNSNNYILDSNRAHAYKITSPRRLHIQHTGNTLKITSTSFS